MNEISYLRHIYMLLDHGSSLTRAVAAEGVRRNHRRWPFTCVLFLWLFLVVRKYHKYHTLSRLKVSNIKPCSTGDWFHICRVQLTQCWLHNYIAFFSFYHFKVDFIQAELRDGESDWHAHCRRGLRKIDDILSVFLFYGVVIDEWTLFLWKKSVSGSCWLVALFAKGSLIGRQQC